MLDRRVEETLPLCWRGLLVMDPGCRGGKSSQSVFMGRWMLWERDWDHWFTQRVNSPLAGFHLRSHTVFYCLKMGKINKYTRHYNPKMLLSVLISQNLALHTCATLLIKEWWGWKFHRSDADLVCPVTMTTRFEQQVYRWQRKVQKMLLKSQDNLFTPIYGASYSCQILIWSKYLWG